MAIQITIVGLGQIGASIGLALGGHKASLKRVGHDKKVDVERAAQSKGAVDEVRHNLPSAVRDAEIVLLCLPVSQVRETLEFIAPDLKEGAVVLDTSPVKSGVFEWAKSILPSNRYFIGLVPAVNPEALHEIKFGVEAARADLFQKGLMVVDAPRGTPGDVVQLASDLARLLGADPLLADPIESDGLMARMHLLPQLAAAALLNSTVDQPGWLEARKLGGRAFAAVTAGLAYQDEIDSLRMAALQNRASTVYALDVMIAALQGLRNDIDTGNEDGIAARLEQALEGRNTWMNDRLKAEWATGVERKPIDIPSFAERFFGSVFVKRNPDQ
ncbi:MAG: prephenate dehydrogenase [Chloroflexota bacterium]